MSEKSAFAKAWWHGVCLMGNALSRPRKTNPYYQGPVSDHYDGTRFFNPGGQTPNSIRRFLEWRMSGNKPAVWPKSVPLPDAPARPAQRVDDLTVTKVGHATLLIQTAGLNILTDPVWSDRVSPLRVVGPKRVTAPGIRFEDLPPIDLILLSHNHYDHLDQRTLARLQASHAPKVLTPLGNDTLVRQAAPDMAVETMDWGDRASFGPLTVHLDPCHHWSARGTRDRSMALWGSFTVNGPRGKVAFIGDTGFDEGRPYKALQRHGALRLLILPIGAYEPRWFMSAQHQNPDEAVRGFRMLDVQHAIGHHWGTFQLTDEARGDPPEALRAALDAQSINPTRFLTLQPGQSWVAPPL